MFGLVKTHYFNGIKTICRYYLEKRNNTKLTVNYNNPIQAPIAAGEEVGTLWFEVNGVREEIPLISKEGVSQLPVLVAFLRQ